MSDGARARLETLFHQARSLEGEERQALLAREAGDDPSLRRELEALLDAWQGATARLEGALGGARKLAAQAVVPAVPERVGPYRIEDEIGRGGLAIVYRGRRVEPDMPQRVAIKIARLATDVALDVRAQQEQWILARLEHPHIARFLDGGRLDDGRFFLVMEYVEGRPIDDACRLEQRSIAERVALLVTVARAVQFAHQNLVLHRDLKPDNILIDAHGNVKLLDFGIAKLLDDAQSPVSSPVTRHDERWLTPAYASPEQRSGDELTTASDVYSLAVVLYRLLTGDTGEAAAGTSGPHLEARIAPSVRLRDPAARAAAGIPPRDGGLGRDLDRVLAKALRAEPGRRYPSPQEFADDLERVLDRRPVRARPDRAGYRLRRFLARHRAAVGAGVIVTASLVTGLGGAIQQTSIARRAEAQAIETLSLIPELIVGADPRQLPGAEVSIDQALTLAIERLRTDAPEDPTIAAAVLEGFGSVLLARSRTEEAFDLLTRSEGLLRTTQRPRALYARICNRLGEAAAALGHLTDAEKHYRRALELRRAEHGPESLEVAETANDLGTALTHLGHFEEAERWLRLALATRIRQLGPQHPDVATVVSNLGTLQAAHEQFEPAAEAFQRAVEISKTALGRDHPSVATNLNNLGVAYYQLGRVDPAIRAFEESLAIRRQTLPQGHLQITESEQNLEAARKLLEPDSPEEPPLPARPENRPVIP